MSISLTCAISLCIIVNKITFVNSNATYPVPSTGLNTREIENLTELLGHVKNLVIYNKDSSFQRPFWYDVYDFQQNKYKEFTKNYPVFISNFTLSYDRLGNLIGNLFNSYACAHVSKAHFLGLWLPSGDIFFDSLPALVIHSNPASSHPESVSNSICTESIQYPWEQTNAPITQYGMGERIRNIMSTAIANKVNAEYNMSHFTLTGNRNHYYCNRNMTTHLLFPRVPNVTIQYRCSDNMYDRGMGLLNFFKIIEVIRVDAYYIYIHTEGRYSNFKKCKEIVHALFKDLNASFPDSVIVVVELFKDLVYSSIATICSASTFCLHTVLGKTTGRVYFPESSIFYGSSSKFDYADWRYMRGASVVVKKNDRRPQSAISIINSLRMKLN